ncbi:MAG: hypothetical protein K0R40_4246 [Burkholderiales bacterium]|jgi:hypothetical protein|nr:hypothetical protein [Burkholderiales bacterium]
MPIASLRWRFDSETLRDVPEGPGVCCLWSGQELVYIGRTEGNTTLRDLLRSFLGARVTHFTWEVTVTPKTRAGDLLDVYLEKHGRLPRLNDAAVLKSREWESSSKDSS